ncbi:MAG: FAD-dependent oxidoreductase [Alphaproteobacteria bacterium]|nr:FAD-dependent oxidoreductase [Alphaproteobacteria bacterium]
MERLETEVIIVGGGIVGCSTALHLRQRGVPVILLEQGQTGAAASGVNFGGVRRNGRALEELAIAARSLEVWRSMPHLLGSDCEYMVTGHLKLARSEADMVALARHAEAQAPFGFKVEMLSRNALLARFPYFGPKVLGAAWCESDGQANPRLVGPAFARAARAAGAIIREHSRVSTVARDGERFLVVCGDDREHHVEVRGRTLINAAGAWANQIAASFGEQAVMEAWSPQMVVTEPFPYFLKPALGVVGGDVYLRQIPRGNFIFGGGYGDATLASGRATVMPKETLGSCELAVQLIPRVAEATVIRVWSGFEGITQDHLPVFGPSLTTPGLTHAFGFSGHGFALSPGVGSIVAELATTGATDVPLGPLSIGRFAKESAETPGR